MTEQEYIKTEQKLTSELAELPEQYVRECFLENKIPDKILDEDFVDEDWDEQMFLPKGTKLYKIPNTTSFTGDLHIQDEFGTIIDDHYFCANFRRKLSEKEVLKFGIPF